MSQIPFSTLDISLRLAELAQLKDGWFDGDGVALNREALSWLANEFELFYSLNALPHLYPTPEGDIRAEWTTPTWDVSLVIDLSKKTAEMHALNLDTDEDIAKSFALSDKKQWESLNTELATLIEP